MELEDLVYIDSTGYHFADYPTFLAWRQQQYRDIYGADTYLENDSQDGQLLAVQALSDYQTAALGASVYNSFSPVTAQGVGLSRLVKINGLSRGIPTNSQVDLQIVGSNGTVIRNGVATDVLNQKWNLPASVTIPSGGTITVTATADALGSVAAEANTITSIFTPTLGWQTVNNSAAATAGAPVESDSTLRIRQQQSTANPSLTVLDGTVGGVANLVGVTSVRGYENDTNSTDGNTLPPHSISIVVAGGDVTDIANEILLHKTPGTYTYGTTSQLVYDAHGMPVTIRFYRPTVVTISVRITLSAKQGWTTDYESLISASVASTINENGIGNTVLISRLYVPAYLVGTAAGETFDISLIEIKKNAGSYVTTNIALAFNEIANTTALTNVSFVVT